MFNPKVLITLFADKDLIKFITLTFCLVLLIPIIAVVVITHTGIQIVSDVLVKVDPATKTVQLFNPDGTLYKAINLKTVWPVRGVITLGFGESDLPYQPFHTGIDIASPNGKVGDSIVAFMPGKVIYAGEISWGYGKHIIIDHGDNLTSLYGHLDTLNVKAGQEVQQGQVIGTEGQTGWATGPHLHFEVRVFGIPVNPIVFLGK